MRFMRKQSFTLIIVMLLAAAILLISGCSAGTSKEQRLEAFIADMESSDSPNPREHFAGHPKADKIDSSTFNDTDMAPNDNLDITGYTISGDTFTMTFTTNTFPDGESVETASFYSETNDLGGEDWYINSMTVPTADGSKIIPDDL